MYHGLPYLAVGICLNALRQSGFSNEKSHVSQIESRIMMKCKTAIC